MKHTHIHLHTFYYRRPMEGTANSFLLKVTHGSSLLEIEEGAPLCSAMVPMYLHMLSGAPIDTMLKELVVIIVSTEIRFNRLLQDNNLHC